MEWRNKFLLQDDSNIIICIGLNIISVEGTFLCC